MARYINVDNLWGKYVEIKVRNGFRKEDKISGRDIALFLGSALDELQSEDVAPVVHGTWLGYADGYADGELVYDIWECSNCGYDADGAEEEPTWKFCPNCGARMDGE